MRTFADTYPIIEWPDRAAASAQILLVREPHFRLGALVIKPSLLEVSAGDRRQRLEPRVMQVLVALARAGGEVVTRDDLIAACWAGRIVGGDAINRCIARLRRLGEHFESGYSIETVPRVGYRLMAAETGEPAMRPQDSPIVRAFRVAFVVAAALAAH